MKLRQKLATVMAAMMMVSSVPVVTSAATNNSLSSATIVTKEDSLFDNSLLSPSITIKSDRFNASEVFYLDLENAKWVDGIDVDTDGDGVVDYVGLTDMKSGSPAAWTQTGVKMERISDTSVKVTIDGTVANLTLQLPLLTKNIKGEAKVTLSTMNSGSTVSNGEWVFATTTNKVSTVTVGSPKAITREGAIADITFKEAYKGSIPADGAAKDKFALVELEDSNFQFQLGNPADTSTYNMTTGVDGKVNGFSPASSGTTGKYKKYTLTNVEFGYGFTGATATIDVYAREDGSAMYVELYSSKPSDSLGTIVLKEMKIKSKDKNPAKGEVKVSISGHVEEVNDKVVAQVTSHGTSLTIKDDKAVDIVAGREETVEFTLSEVVEDSLSQGRNVTFKLENAYFADEVEDNKAETLSALKAAITSMQHKKGNTVTEETTAMLLNSIEDTVVEDGKIIGFEMKVPQNDELKLDAYTFKVKVRVGLEQSGEIKLTAEGRAIDEVKTLVLGQAKECVKVEAEAAVLKAGLLGQVKGKITVTENDKAILGNGQELVVELPVQSGIVLSKDKAKRPQVTVTSGDVQLGEIKVVDSKDSNGKDIQELRIEIKRSSKEASKIEITNFHFDTDRTVAEGSYDVKLGGKALTNFGETFKIKEFIKIGTTNTEDLVGQNGLAKGTSTFVIGQSKYTINGVEKTMDATSYIQNPGYTMIPVRYVAEAFGVTGNDILFSNGTATIFAGNRTIQLENNSNVATVNGAKVTMGTKVVIKNGRTYAPVGEIARLLGISTEWDNTTKTATFINK